MSPEIMNQPVAPLTSRDAAASRSSGASPEITNQPVASLTSRNAAVSRSSGRQPLSLPSSSSY